MTKFFSRRIAHVNLSSASLAAVLLIPLATLGSCDNQPVVLTGTWRGANREFNDVTLVLKQFRDSVAGAISLTYPAYPTSPIRGTLTSGHVVGDSLEVSSLRQPSSGYTSIGFAGHLFWITNSVRLGSATKEMLSGHVLFSSTPDTMAINLFRQ